MKDEFKLDDWIVNANLYGFGGNFLPENRVKEFIKKLKDKIRSYKDFELMAKNIMIDIDDLTGDKLI